MDSLITAAARALALGDPLTALKRVALREDPPALALRGIAMAQFGELKRAKELLRRAARGFGADEPMARARCGVAEAEIALVSRDLGASLHTLEAARAVLDAHGDHPNAAHARYLQARHLLLVGRLDEAEHALRSVEENALPPASRTGYWLVAAGIAMRRIQARTAGAALAQARSAAQAARIPALAAEVEQAARALNTPAARLIERDEHRLLGLAEVEALIASQTLAVDACRGVVRSGPTLVPLAGRPVLFTLVRTLAEAWPEDAAREALIARAFRARAADDSHRARLRVEIGRLRKALRPLAGIVATGRGFALKPYDGQPVALFAPPVEGNHADMLALLADGEAWSSSALALALGVSPRTVQRALEALALEGKVDAYGKGRACRWTARSVPGFPTSLLLPVQPTGG